MASNDNTLTQRARADETSLDEHLIGCLDGTLTAFERLASACLPRLLGVSARFIEPGGQPQARHREAVCRDTLQLAWRNLPALVGDTSPSLWLYGIFASRLHNQLLAFHGSQQALQDMLSVIAAKDAAPSEAAATVSATVDSPTGPRPALLSGRRLQAMSHQVPLEAPSQRLMVELNERIAAEIAQHSAPLTPTGERVYPPLYDPALRHRMFRSRAAFRLKEGFKRHVGRPFEDALFRRWLDSKAGAAPLESQGLPRRSVEAYLGGRLDLEIDPRSISRCLDFPAAFPRRTQRRKILNLFIWPGDWDLKTAALSDSQRRKFIGDIWAHRLDLTASDSYASLMRDIERGRPRRMHHQGILLDSEIRVLTYLGRYLLYMEGMSCFGYNAGLGKDALGIAIDRHGAMIKINKGLHRLAMAQVLGIERGTVRVRAVHQHWWQRHKGSAHGKRALENIAAALAS